MKTRFRQQGVSFFGLVLILVVLAFVVLIGLKVLPIYMESFKIDAALKGVIEMKDVEKMSTKDIVRTLSRRLEVDDVDIINARDYKEHLTITKKKDKVMLDVNYTAEAPLFKNLKLVADFNKHVEN